MAELLALLAGHMLQILSETALRLLSISFKAGRMQIPLSYGGEVVFHPRKPTLRIFTWTPGSKSPILFPHLVQLPINH